MKKVLVAYFSASGRTERVAKLLSEAVGGELFKIEPKVPYTRADLDWTDKKSRSTIEMNDPASRPEMGSRLENLSSFDVVFLGFPIWWYTAPSIIHTFLERYDFAGKKIVLFATSGGSGFGRTRGDLLSSVPKDAQIVEGKVLNGDYSLTELKGWAEKF